MEEFFDYRSQIVNCNTSSINKAMTLVNQHGSKFDISQMLLKKWKKFIDDIEANLRLFLMKFIIKGGNDVVNAIMNEHFQPNL